MSLFVGFSYAFGCSHRYKPWLDKPMGHSLGLRWCFLLALFRVMLRASWRDRVRSSARQIFFQGRWGSGVERPWCTEDARGGTAVRLSHADAIMENKEDKELQELIRHPIILGRCSVCPVLGIDTCADPALSPQIQTWSFLGSFEICLYILPRNIDIPSLDPFSVDVRSSRGELSQLCLIQALISLTYRDMLLSLQLRVWLKTRCRDRSAVVSCHLSVGF